MGASKRWLRRRSRRERVVLLVCYVTLVAFAMTTAYRLVYDDDSWGFSLLAMCCSMAGIGSNIWIQAKYGPSEVARCKECRGHGYVKRSWHDLGSGVPCAACRGQGFHQPDGSPAPRPYPRAD